MASLNSPSASDEPQGRLVHCSAAVGGVSYTWGGLFGAAPTPEDHSSTVHCFHSDSESWIKRPTTGQLPPGWVTAACTVIGVFLYVFAGTKLEGDYFNTIHRLDTRRFVWLLLEPVNPQDAPMCKAGAAMTSYNDEILVTIGGYGPLPEKRSDRVEYVQDQDGIGSDCTLNELVCFDITARTWFSPLTTGRSPPACAACSLIRVDRLRAVFYGGHQLSKTVQTTHILNLKEWEWSEMVSSGGPGQSWPVARTFHSAVSLCDPDSDPADPAMMVMYGSDDNRVVFNDAWMLRVNTEQWRKVVLPASLEGCMCHTTTVVYCTSARCKLVHYGGVMWWPEDGDLNETTPIANTTILDMECEAGEWAVSDVIPASQLGQPRESKHTLPKHVQLTLAEEMRHLTVCDRVMREKGKLVIRVVQCMLSGPPRVGKSSLLSRLVPPPETPQTPAAPDTPSPPTPPLASQPTISTGVAEGILQVYVKNATQLIAIASPDPLEKIWQLLELNIEAVTFLKMIVSSFSSQSQEALPDVPAIAAASPDTPATSSPTAEGASLGPTTSADAVKSKGGLSLFRFKGKKGGAKPVTIPLPGYKSIEDVFKDALKSKKWGDARTLLEGSYTLYFTDTGGQPECQEILPGLIAGPSLFLLVFNLMHSLDRRYKVQFIKSTSEKTVEYDSSFTVKEVLLRSLASIAATCTYSSHTSKDPIPIKARVMIVGTHSDQVSSEHIRSTQKELNDTLMETGFYKLLVFASEDEPVIVINNLATDESDFNEVRRQVERIADHPSFRVPIPTPWLAFSLCLRLLDDSVAVLSYEQCSSIAGECGIDTEEEVKEALWHLHTKMGVLRYFHSIPELQDIVITKPQLIFSKITELIARTFTFHNPNVFDPHTVKTFEQQGIFSVDAIAELTATSSELLSSAKLVKLLEALHIIAPIRDEAGKIVQYFIPCVLTHAPEYQAEGDSNALLPSLLVTFNCGYCPKGLFCALVAYLLTVKVCCGLTWRLETKKVYRNRVSFKVGKEHSIVSITAHLTHLEVSLDAQTDASRCLLATLPHEICSTIRQAMKESISAVSQTLHYGSDTATTFGFPCPSCPLKPAVCLEEEEPTVRECVSCKASSDLTPHHLTWFGVPLPCEDEATAETVEITEQSLETPSELDLKRALSTVTDWFELGELLGLPYDLLEEIQIDLAPYGTKRQRSKLVHSWLQRDPAASWSKLCGALERMGENTAAQDIRTKHMAGAGLAGH